MRLITLSSVDTRTPQPHSAYPKELSAKTRRGLDALAGYATGGFAYGLCGRKVTSDDGNQRPLIEVTFEQAKVIRRVFRLYLQGSLSA